MIRKEFEVWERQKRKEEKEALEALQETFASNGLAYSGQRAKAEERLREKFVAEIETARLKMEDEEHQKISWVPNGNWRPWVLSLLTSIVASIIAVLASLFLKGWTTKIIF